MAKGILWQAEHISSRGHSAQTTMKHASQARWELSQATCSNLFLVLFVRVILKYAIVPLPREFRVNYGIISLILRLSQFLNPKIFFLISIQRKSLWARRRRRRL